MIDNILILGTSHISSDSVNQIKNTFLDFKPDIVAVELDKNRLFSLKHPQKKIKANIFLQIKTFGVTGFVFATLGKYLQKKLGSIVKTNPGADMLMAVNLAQNNSLQLELMDQDIQITLKKFSKAFSFKEKMKLLKDLILSPFSKKQKINFDIKKVPEEKIITQLIDQVKSTYPSIYFVFIEERNQIMAKNLIRLHKLHPDKKIFAVVGAGHKEGMLLLLKKYNLLFEKP